MLRNFEMIAPSTAASTWASSKTMNGALPPSSSPTFFTVPAACAISTLPTSVEPVKPTTRTAGCSVIALPIARASPVTKLSTPGRHAGAQRQFAKRERGQRRLARGLRHHGAADRDRRRDLAGDHRRREIPRRDRRDHADRLLDDDDAGIGAEGRIDLAVDALRLLAEKLDIGGGVVDLAARLRERLPLFAGHDERDVVAIGDDEVEPAAQDLRALLRQCLRPRAEGALRRFDRANRLGFAKARRLGEHRAGRGVGDGTRPLPHPFSVDKALAFQERGIGEFHGEGLQGWRAYSKESGRR